MSVSQKGTKAISITRIASFYVISLLFGGMAIFGALSFARSEGAIFACAAAAAVAFAGIIYCAKKVASTLQA